MNNFHRILLVALTSLIAAIDISAQQISYDGAFSFALNREGKLGGQEAIPKEKFAVAKSVFEKLVEAKGVKNMPQPIFEMHNSEQRPAWVKPKDRLVVLEEKAFDSCMKLGKDSLNGLAALISHELIHYYEKHDWKEHFLNRNRKLESNQTLTEQDDGLSLELQADHLGGLLAHMAGYNTLGVMPKLLDELYQAYNLEHQADTNYPSVDERRIIAQNSDVLLTKHSRIFDMANYLTVAGEYEQARMYLEFLLDDTKFQSREIYNNLGVLSTLEAIDLMPASQLKFHFPIEIELDTRLSNRAVSSEEVQELLDAAMDNFKTANILDENFGKALLNIANVHAIKGEWMDAEYFALKAQRSFEKFNNTKGVSDATVLLGIIAASTDDVNKAKVLFKKANTNLGEINLCQLDSESGCEYQKNQKRQYRKVIDNTDLDKMYARIMQDKEQAMLNIELDNENSFHTIAKENSEVLVSLNSRIMGQYTLFQIITDDVLQFGKDIKIGSSRLQLEESLGQPDKLIAGVDKSLLLYHGSNAIFTINKTGEIIEWSIYKISR